MDLPALPVAMDLTTTWQPRQAQPMDSTASAGPVTNNLLPPELRLHVLSLLPPNDLALAARLTSKDAAHRFSQPPARHRTVHLTSLPLPAHAVHTAWCMDAVHAAAKQLTLRQKLLLLIHSPASGCEANVEFMLQLMQQQLFPELLHTDHYLAMVPPPRIPCSSSVRDLGSAAVAGGLSHLLPSLAQRCPGLLDPGATLEAAARHCDLAGLQAAWGVLGERMVTTLLCPNTAGQQWREERVAGALQRMLAAAAGCTTADAVAKMDWLLVQGRGYGLACHVCMWNAAAASGDAARLRWLQDHGFSLHMCDLPRVLLKHASLGFIQQLLLQQEGSCLQLPPQQDAYWRSPQAAHAAACSPTDSAAKLRWLAARGAALGGEHLLTAAVASSCLEAAQVLWQHWRAENPGDGAPLPYSVEDLVTGICYLGTGAPGDGLRLAAWLRQKNTALALTPNWYANAAAVGDLPLLRWLLQAGCPRGGHTVEHVLDTWPCDTPADSERLVEAVRLMADAGWPVVPSWSKDTSGVLLLRPMRHPWSVRRALLDTGLVPSAAVHQRAFADAPGTGCVEMVEAVVQHPDHTTRVHAAAAVWYAVAAAAGDLGTMACLLRLGVPLNVAVLKAAIERGAPLPALKWMVGQGVHVGGGGELREAVGKLSEYYHSPRGQEPDEVEAWLKGRVEGRVHEGKWAGV